MYSEATAALGPAVKADEFNGELRYLYGSALQGLKKYDDAVLNFRLSLRLDNSRWEAAEHVLQCYSEKFAQSSSNQDRILLGEAAAQLAAIPSAGDTDPAGGRDLREAQQRAQALITILNSPVGTWSDGRLQLSVKSRADNGFDIFMNEKESYLSGTFRRRDATEFGGSAMYGSVCLFDIDFTAQLLDAGTQLLLEEQRATRYIGPNPISSPSLERMRVQNKVCRDLMRKARGSPFYPLKLSLQRVQ